MVAVIEFHGGPRDGEVYAKPLPPAGRYWFDRTVARPDHRDILRSDLYELRGAPCPGWYYITTKEGHHKP